MQFLSSQSFQTMCKLQKQIHAECHLFLQQLKTVFLNLVYVYIMKKTMTFFYTLFFPPLHIAKFVPRLFSSIFSKMEFFLYFLHKIPIIPIIKIGKIKVENNHIFCFAFLGQWNKPTNQQTSCLRVGIGKLSLYSS